MRSTGCGRGAAALDDSAVDIELFQSRPLVVVIGIAYLTYIT
jgi:hypothetical protein